MKDDDDRFGSLEIKKKQSKKNIAEEGLALNCPACGALYRLDSNFCSNCGGDLRKIKRKSVPTHKGLGSETSAHSISTPPKKPMGMGYEEYSKRRGEIKQELKYRYIYIMIFVLFLILLFVKSKWFIF
jgi:hypothetical protein